MHLRNDISAHPLSATLFMMWWLVVFAFTFATWSGGMSAMSVWLHVATAVIAGALVAYWRFPVSEGLLARGWRLAGPPMAGSLVAIVIVSVVFVREALFAGTGDVLDVARAAELFVSWAVATAILAAIGLLCGLVGGWVGRLVAYFERRERVRQLR